MGVELEDVGRVVEATGAEYVLGVSSGALLTLQACLSPPPSWNGVKKVVIFEPPLLFSDRTEGGKGAGIDIGGVRRYEQEMDRGDVVGALLTAVRVVQLGPRWMPPSIMRVLTSLMLYFQRRGSEDGKGEEDRGVVSMEQMAPLLRYDFALAEFMVGSAERFRIVKGERKVLLLGGERSPRYVKAAMDELERVMEGEGMERAVLSGVGHEVLCNKEMRGDPGKALGVLQLFLGV